jgi:hypothetical protein
MADQLFTRDTFDARSYLRDFENVTNIPDEITEEQRDIIYDKAVRRYLEETDQEKGIKREEAIDRTLQRFGDDARPALGIPEEDPDQDAYLSLGNMSDYNQQRSRGLLPQQTVEDSIKAYASYLTSDENRYRLPKFAPSENLSRKEINNALTQKLLADAEAQGIPVDEPLEAHTEAFAPKPVEIDVEENITVEEPPEPGLLDKASDVTSFVGNTIRNFGKRAANLSGEFVGFVDTTADAIEQSLGDFGLGEITYRPPANVREIFTFENFGYRSAEENQELRASNQYPERLTSEISDELRSVNLGYVPQATWDQVKTEFSEGGALSGSAWGETFAFAFEQGVGSIPDMVASVVALPAYVGARINEIGESRAKNKGKIEADMTDLLEAAPFAVAASVLERIGAKSVLDAGEEAIEKTGTEILKAGFKAGGVEASTEAFQSGVLEYVGERFGTEARMTLAESWDQALAGAVAGGITGAQLGTLSAALKPQATPDQTPPADPDEPAQASTEGFDGVVDISNIEGLDADTATLAGFEFNEENQLTSVKLVVEREQGERVQEVELTPENGVVFDEVSKQIPESFITSDENFIDAGEPESQPVIEEPTTPQENQNANEEEVQQEETIVTEENVQPEEEVTVVDPTPQPTKRKVSADERKRIDEDIPRVLDLLKDENTSTRITAPRVRSIFENGTPKQRKALREGLNDPEIVNRLEKSSQLPDDPISTEQGVKQENEIAQGVLNIINQSEPQKPDLDSLDSLSVSPETLRVKTPADIVKTESGNYVAVGRGKTAEGQTPEAAQAALDSEVNTTGSLLPKAEADIVVDGDTASVFDDQGRTLISFTGKQAEERLSNLIDSNNAEGTLLSGFRLLNGLRVEDTNDGFKLSLGDVSVTSGSVNVKALRTLQQKHFSKLRKQNINIVDIEHPETEVTIPVHFPEGKTLKKQFPGGFRPPEFKKKQLAATLQNQGFVNIAVKPKTVTMERNGLTYSVDISNRAANPLSSGRSNPSSDRTANVTVRDKKGIIVGKPQNIALSNVDGEPVLRELKIEPPKIGFVVNRPIRAGERMPPRFDVSNIERVAKRTGGDVVRATPTYAQVAYNRVGDQGNTFHDSLILTVDGEKVYATTTDGKKQEIKGGSFRVEDVVGQTNFVTKELTDLGYSRQQDGRYANTRGHTVSVEDGTIITDTKEVVTLDQLAQDKDDKPLARAKTVVDNIKSRVTVEDNKFIMDDGEQKISFGVDTVNDLDSLLFDIATERAVSLPDSEIKKYTDKDELSIGELEHLTKVLFGERVSRLVKFHPGKPEAIFGKDSVGKFLAKSDESGKMIHIASAGGPPNEVLAALAEEVSHLGFDLITGNFANQSIFTNLYSKLYAAARADIINSPRLHDYINKYGINTNNPSKEHTYILVNEYFSGLGVSILDFQGPGQRLPTGMSQNAFETIKKEVVDAGVKDMIIDLSSKAGGKQSKETAQKLIEDIIRLQTAATRDRGFKVSYKTDTGSYVVTPTPFGKSNIFIPDPYTQVAANKTTKRRLFENKLGEYADWSNTAYNLVKYFRKANPIDKPIDSELLATITAKGTLRESVEARSKRGIQETIEQANKIRRDFNIPELSVDQSYSKVFKDYGVKKQKDLQVADALDKFNLEVYDLNNEAVQKINDEYRRAKEVLKSWAQNDPTGNAAKLLPKQLAALERFQEKNTLDWSHRRYKAYTTDRISTLNTMLAEVKGGVDNQKLKKKYDNAVKTLKKLEAAKNKTVKVNRAIFQEKETIDTYKRLLALESWANRIKFNSPNVQQTVPQLMAETLTRVISEKKLARAIVPNELSQVSSLKSRTLELTGTDQTADDLYADFLGRITDPTEAALHDYDQRGQVLSILKQKNRMAEQIVEKGVGLYDPVIGTVGGFSFTKNNNKTLASDGTLMDFVSIDDAFSDYISRTLNNYNDFFQNNDLARFADMILSQVKRNLVVRNINNLVTSYEGGFPTLLGSGHLLDVKGTKGAFGDLKNAWLLRFSKTASPNQYISDLVESMMEHNVLGSGLNAATLETTAASNFVKEVADFVDDHDKSGLVAALFKKAKKVDDLNADVFSFADDWIKVFSFASNRTLGVKHADHLIKRNQFPNGPNGDIQYETALKNEANRFAAERTRMETVVWEETPLFLKSLTNFRFITPNFAAHYYQIARIISNNHRMIVEDLSTARRMYKEGNTELSAEFGKAAIRRLAGTALNDGVMVSNIGFRFAAFAWLGHTILQSLGFEDEKETPFKEGNFYTDAQFESAQFFTRTLMDEYGGTWSLMPYRDGENLIFADLPRMNQMLTFLQSGGLREESFDKSFKDKMKKFANNFILLEDKGIAEQFTETMVRGEAPNGFGEATDEDKIKTVSGFATPVAFREVYELVTAEKFFSGAPISRTEAGMRLLGVKNKKINMHKLLSIYGRRVKRLKNQPSGTDRKGLIQVLNTGNLLHEDQIRMLVGKYSAESENLFLEISEAIGHAKTIMKTKNGKPIIKMMAKDPRQEATGAGIKDLEVILAGKNPFKKELQKKLKDEITRLKKLNPEKSGYSQEQINNMIANNKKAIALYSNPQRRTIGE